MLQEEDVKLHRTNHHYFCNQGQKIQLSKASMIHGCLQGHFSLDKDSTVTALHRTEDQAEGSGGLVVEMHFQQLENRVHLQPFDPGRQSQILPRKVFQHSVGKASDYCFLLQRCPPLSEAHISA